MSIKLLPIIALTLGLSIGAARVRGADSPFDYDSPTAARQVSAIDEAPPTGDDEPLPELKKPIETAKKPSSPKTTTDANSKPLPKSFVDHTKQQQQSVDPPKLLPPNVKARPTYANGVSNWPTQTPAAAQKASANFSGDSWSSGSPTDARSSTAASTNRPGQIARPSQQFAQNSASNSQGYRSDNRLVSGNQPSAAAMSPESIVSGSPMDSNSAMEAWEDTGPGLCNSCNSCNPCCYNGVNLCGSCGWFGGVDYLLMRPSFSEDQAYIKRVTTTDAQENVTVTDTVVHQDFGYNSGTRAFFGYRCSCNEEIRFTYWNYGAHSAQSTGVANEDGTILYAGQLELNTTPGQRIEIESGLRANVYDIEYSKCCCNPCNSGNCCPPWTLKYSAGARIAEVDRHDDNFLIDTDGSGARAALISADFIGAGPRVGLEGRRFFRGGHASVFARTNLSLLLGEYNIDETRRTPTTAPTLTEHYFDSHDRIIPVAEIELGGSWQVTQRLNLSAGYLFQAWWDLGAFEQIQGNVFLNPIDDSNIMAFDGLFARLEYCF
jgi:hypothetical protein